jgi:hypothetical protein
VCAYIIILPTVGVLKFVPEINKERSGSSFTNLLQTVPPLPHIITTLNVIEQIIRDAVHDEVLDCLIVILPLYGRLDAVDVTTIDVCLCDRAAGQVVLPVVHLHGDGEVIVVHDPVGAIGGQPD